MLMNYSILIPWFTEVKKAQLHACKNENRLKKHACRYLGDTNISTARRNKHKYKTAAHAKEKTKVILSCVCTTCEQALTFSSKTDV